MNIFISPHPDDVVLSCGGRLLKEKNNLVINIFCRSYDNPTDWDLICGLKRSPMNRRVVEDKNILNKIGVESIHLDFFDNAHYEDEGKIRPKQEVDKIFGRIEKTRSRYPNADLFFPAGINHPDHILLAGMGKSLGADLYYEDLPYGLLVDSEDGIDYPVGDVIDRKIELISDYKTQEKGLMSLISVDSFDDFLKRMKDYHQRNDSFFERFYLKNLSK